MERNNQIVVRARSDTAGSSLNEWGDIGIFVADAVSCLLDVMLALLL